MAGTGKTTLTELLCRDDRTFVRAEFLHTRSPAHVRYLLHALPRLWRILLADLRLPPRLSWRDVKLLVYVTEWARFLDRSPRHGARVTVFDQGPIYALVRLRARASGVTGHRSFAGWWDDALRAWGGRLDTVVLLDGDDGALGDRIDGRGGAHEVKGGSPQVREAFLARYRALFEEVLGRLDVPGGPRIVRLDTTGIEPEPLAGQLRNLLGSSGTGEVPARGRVP